MCLGFALAIVSSSLQFGGTGSAAMRSAAVQVTRSAIACNAPSTDTVTPVGADEALSLYDSLRDRAAKDDALGVALRQALDACAQALRLYGPDAVVTSFNGGKDAVAILHLMRASLAHHQRQATSALIARSLVPPARHPRGCQW